MCLAASPAYAQRCEIVYEEITRLNPPDFGHYSIWDEVYGDKGMDQISDFVILTDGSVVMGGAYTSDEEDNTYKPLLVHITPQGKFFGRCVKNLTSSKPSITSSKRKTVMRSWGK